MNQPNYLSRLIECKERIDQWRSIGPACSKEEWTDMEDAWNDIDELMRLIKANDNYIAPGYRLKKANKYWNMYNVKNIETIKIAKGEIHDIFLNNKKKRNG
jgi:hypothetical protein